MIRTVVEPELRGWQPASRHRSATDEVPDSEATRTKIAVDPVEDRIADDGPAE